MRTTRSAACRRRLRRLRRMPNGRRPCRRVGEPATVAINSPSSQYRFGIWWRTCIRCRWLAGWKSDNFLIFPPRAYASGNTPAKNICEVYRTIGRVCVCVFANYLDYSTNKSTWPSRARWRRQRRRCRESARARKILRNCSAPSAFCSN